MDWHTRTFCLSYCVAFGNFDVADLPVESIAQFGNPIAVFSNGAAHAVEHDGGGCECAIASSADQIDGLDGLLRSA